MKRIIAMVLALIFAAAFCTVGISAEETVTPTNYWDFVETYPTKWNFESFAEDYEAGTKFEDAKLPRSEEGHLLLKGKQGDDATSHLQIFINEEDKGGTSMKDNDVVVARFRFSDNTYAKETSYHANFGYIGMNPAAGNETYVTPNYINTYDWQVMYFDCQDDSWSVDIWYFVWFWFKEALFPFDVEIDYIATFADMESAQAYVASRGHDVEPPLITETEEETTEPVTTEKPAVSDKTTDSLPNGSGTNGADDTKAPAAEDGGSNAVIWIIVAVAAVIVIVAVAVVATKKKKK